MTQAVREILLQRRGLAYLGSHGAPLPDAHVRAFELELARMGRVLSARLRARLLVTTLDELVAFRAWALGVLFAHVGGGPSHEPLFRSFPEGIPEDTTELWWSKVLVHFLQGEEEPCLFCGNVGTTHVLAPCAHVVCDRCFDGAKYSACPVCEHHVDRSSPFFQPSPARPLPTERILFTRLDLGGDLVADVRALFASLCARTQPLSPDDRDLLVTILREHRALPWLPEQIPLKENVATVFGVLFDTYPPDEILAAARPFLKTATDVLRLLAVRSGKDASLMPGVATVQGVARKVRRFPMAKLGRPLRRALLSLLEGFDPERLKEDMLRHQSYWVWAGEFLHPHEYAARYPNVAAAFSLVRKKAPDGTVAPRHRSFQAKAEIALATRDAAKIASALGGRPGDFARRLDHALRIADEPATIVRAFLARISKLSTPMLLGLRRHVETRRAPLPVRIYWPKGQSVARPDERPPLPEAAIAAVAAATDDELLRRFGAKEAFEIGILDAALATIPVPFAERSAARSALALPRGASLAVPTDRVVRLFLHWCQPEDGEPTDLDLSVGFYDEAWKHVATCSFYELVAKHGAETLAASSGDLRDAPAPDGATEYIDIHRDVALAAGVRHAAMVVTSYAGLPFDRLERAFAGLMLRSDPGGQHFDPRTVELKFELAGENGVYLPLVLDIRENRLHWLDVYAKGAFEMNTLVRSSASIRSIGPEHLAYFASGTRPSMFGLGALHVAARCRRVFVRGETVAEYVRRAEESVSAFHARIVAGDADEPRSRGPRDEAALAVLLRGDLELGEGSAVYALVRERLVPTLEASDLLA